MRYIIVDLDHTLCDSSWRDHLMNGLPKEDHHHTGWDLYNSEAVHDQPVVEIMELVKALDCFKILIITARPERFRKITKDWLDKWKIPHHHLLMRDNGETTPSAILKPSLAIRFLLGGEKPLFENVAFVLDDREDVCRAFKALGITTLQVSIRSVSCSQS